MLVLALVVAVAAAVRSTWSPCGVSMLSTLVPLTERGRGHRWGGTAAWFVAGATLGGVCLGLLAAVAAAVVGMADVSTTTVAVLAAALALIALASDHRILGFRLPSHTRQVNEDWTAIYRPWVYAGGFGWQIGVGLATYTVTAGVYLTIAYAALTGEPVAAALVGTVFGLVRGFMIFLGIRLDSPARMRAFHRRFEAAREPSRVGMSLVLFSLALITATAAGGLVGALGVIAVVGGAALAQRAQGRAPRTAAALDGVNANVAPI